MAKDLKIVMRTRKRSLKNLPVEDTTNAAKLSNIGVLPISHEIPNTFSCLEYYDLEFCILYRDVPGVDTAYLAMDTEEGVEVVWNEAVFSGSKKFKNKEEDKLKNVFEALTLIDHPNIVKFHRFWTDNGTSNEKSGQKEPPRVCLSKLQPQSLRT